MKRGWYVITGPMTYEHHYGRKAALDAWKRVQKGPASLEDWRGNTLRRMFAWQAK